MLHNFITQTYFPKHPFCKVGVHGMAVHSSSSSNLLAQKFLFTFIITIIINNAVQCVTPLYTYPYVQLIFLELTHHTNTNTPQCLVTFSCIIHDYLCSNLYTCANNHTNQLNINWFHYIHVYFLTVSVEMLFFDTLVRSMQHWFRVPDFKT